jgi:hypothetical protein
MLPTAQAEENGSLRPPHKPAVFLPHASPPSHFATDSEHVISAFVWKNRNRWVRAGERIQSKGFPEGIPLGQFRCRSSTIQYSNKIQAPKLMACASGIESAGYDFERFLPLQKLKKAGCRKAAFGYFLLCQKCKHKIAIDHLLGN